MKMNGDDLACTDAIGHHHDDVLLLPSLVVAAAYVVAAAGTIMIQNEADGDGRCLVHGGDGGCRGEHPGDGVRDDD